MYLIEISSELDESIEREILMMRGYFGKQYGNVHKCESLCLLQTRNSTLFIPSGGNNYKFLTF